MNRQYLHSSDRQLYAAILGRRYKTYLEFIRYAIAIGDEQAAYVYARLSYRLALSDERQNGY